jgi:hypothetical protein
MIALAATIVSTFLQVIRYFFLMTFHIAAYFCLWPRPIFFCQRGSNWDQLVPTFFQVQIYDIMLLT